MRKLVFLDLETGGLDKNKSAILTIGLTITNELYHVLFSEEFKIPIKGEVSEKALEVNGLDLSNRDKTYTVEEVVNVIGNIAAGEDISIIGHNVGHFDMSMLEMQYPVEYKRLIDMSKRDIIDTKSLIGYLRLKGLYSGSTSMHKIMGIEGQHSAAKDTRINLELLKLIDKLLGL